MADAYKTVFQRYEKKFLVDTSCLPRLLAHIEEHMDVDPYCREGKTYRISNLYYDTAGDDVIRESLKKPFYKEKLRMRCYGIPESDRTPVFLELKKKVNKIVTKRRTSLSYGEALAFLDRGILPDRQDYMTRQVLREIAYYLTRNTVYPSARITYDRMAYFGREDDSFRLTFDRDIRYLKAGSPENPVDFQDSGEGLALLPDRFYLMEVKVSEAYPLWFAEVLSWDEIYRVSFSKFGAAYKTELMRTMDSLPDHITILSSI